MECLCAPSLQGTPSAPASFLLKGKMGRAGGALSAYFSETINSVHKTYWSKTLKRKSTFSLQPVGLRSGRQQDLKCQ